MSDEVRWVAVYERVSSDDQRERETIKTQTGLFDRHLAMHPNARVYRWYPDDGVSGTIPMIQRPAGKRLLEDAMKGRFTEIWVTRPDRLGRNEIDLLQLYALLEGLGVKLVGIVEPIGDRFIYGIHAVVSAASRRRFLAQSAEGMARAAREGRYTGGIVPLGYKVEGWKHTARLVPSDIVLWRGWSEADALRHIYRRLAVDGWSCLRVADELNVLGVPTVYQKDGREVKERHGTRKRRTQGRWRAGRVRNLVINPVYRGKLQYGRRSTKDREIIEAEIEGLVSDAIWQAAQETLARNRIMAKNTNRIYLLRGAIVCGGCRLHYSGCRNRGQVRYKCNGALREPSTMEGRCGNPSFYGEPLETAVWSDVERFLRDPGDILDELTAELDGSSVAATAEADRLTLTSAVGGFADQKDRILDLYRRDLIAPDDLEGQLAKIAAEQHEIEKRLRVLDAEVVDQPEPVSPDVLTQIRARLDDGLDERARQEIVSILVNRIEIQAGERCDGRLRAIAEYRFPGVVSFSTGMGSSPPPS